MAKTRRTKTNRSPKNSSPNVRFAVVEEGIKVKIKGHRTAPGSKMQPDKDARPVFLGRVYTGVNRGKSYPYASEKRSAAK